MARFLYPKQRIKKMSEQIDIESVINNALKGIRSQLDSAFELATGPARNVISNLLSEQGLLYIHFNAIMGAANADADEFNSLVGELESRDSELSKVELSLASIKSQLASAELAKSELEAEAAELKSGNKLMEARLDQQEQKHREHAKKFLTAAKDLKEAQKAEAEVERLKRHGKKKQAELDELRAASVTLRTELAKHRKEKANIAGDLADAAARNTYLQDVVEDLQNRLTFNDGDVVDRMFEAENGAHLYVYTFGFGVRCQEKGRELIATNWHSEIRSTTGHCVMVMTDDNLSPVIPKSSEIGAPPQELIELLKEQALSRCKDEFPELYARRLWSEASDIRELGLPDPVRNKLTKAGINTIFDVLTHPQHVMIKLPGIGEATATAAQNAAKAAVNAWEKERQAEQRKASKKAA